MQAINAIGTGWNSAWSPEVIYGPPTDPPVDPTPTPTATATAVATATATATATVTVTATPTVAPTAPPAPTITFGNTAKVAGTLTVGSKIRVKKYQATVIGGTPTYKFQWYADNAKIKKATKQSLLITKAMKGKKLKVKVTAVVAAVAKSLVVKAGRVAS